ncbi:DUF370 domain-containing protein [Eubacteriales bacterium OttesenSCG-928-G02]|nr:DUF370 domain-containing protein [Eubacteriales bacterium OttesenSCG-928-G02]
MKLCDIGFGNTVNVKRVICVVSPESLPVRRLIQDAKNINRVIDVTCGKKTKSVILTDSEHIILSATEVEDLKNKFNG